MTDFSHSISLDYRAPQLIADRVDRRQSFGRFMKWDATLPVDLIAQLWEDPAALLARGRVLQDKPRCRVVQIDHPAGQFVMKYHNWGGPIRTLKKSLRSSPAKKCWLDGRLLCAADVPTPRPKGFVVRRWGPLGVGSYLLTDSVPGTTLYRFLRFNEPSAEILQPIAQQVAAIWQQLAELQVSHNDLKTENFMIDPAGKVWLIDLEKMRRHRRSDEVRKRQAEDAHRFFHPRNWRSNPAAAEIFRQHILQTETAADWLRHSGGHNNVVLKNNSVHKNPLSHSVPTENDPEQLMTVLIPFQNDAQTIADCVESVRDVADEIVLVDLGSNDNTREVAQSAAACRVDQAADADKVDANKIESDKVEMLNWAQNQAAHPWILTVFPDERVSAELSKELQDVLARNPEQDGFRITLRYYFCGQLVKYGGFRNRSVVRLHRREIGRYVLRRGRPKVQIDSKNVGLMSCKLQLDRFRGIDDHLREMDRIAAGPVDFLQSNAARIQRRASPWRAPWKFIKSYILQLGFLDGRAGFDASWLSAQTAYLQAARIWEQNRARTRDAKAEQESIAHPNTIPLNQLEEQATTAENSTDNRRRLAA